MLLSCILLAVLLTPFLREKVIQQFGGSPNNVISIYDNHMAELEDINNVLKRPTGDPDEHIENLEQLGQEYTPYVPSTEIKSQGPPPGTEELPNLKKIDGEYYYFDPLYPRDYISVDFYLDPVKFAKERPYEYPSYIVASKK